MPPNTRPADDMVCSDPSCSACSYLGLANTRLVSINVSWATDSIRTLSLPTADELILRDETTCPCGSCLLKKGMLSNVGRSEVHDYSHYVAWRSKKTRGDTFPYAMGVELETSYIEYDEKISNEHAADMRRPKAHWVAKRDSSVSGPEFASHPATLTWWHKHANDLSQMFSLLIHAGFRSHTGEQAGMHVNISKTAFSSPEHLLRFLRLVNLNPEWSRILSQRTQDQVDHYAWLGREWDLPSASQALLDNGRYGTTDKYEAINIPAGQKRVEFRLPRGTLRVDRFLKNLEWTAAMIGYTRTETDSTSVGFLSWARKFPQVYSNLIAFMDEKSELLNTYATYAK